MTDVLEELERLSSYTVHTVLATKGRRVFAELGPTGALVRCASVRKSLMNGLIGAAVNRGLLRLDATLADLDINDVKPLTPTERQATLRDLLMARSGVYHRRPQGLPPPPSRRPRGQAVVRCTWRHSPSRCRSARRTCGRCPQQPRTHVVDGTTQTGDVPVWRNGLPVIRRLVDSAAAR